MEFGPDEIASAARPVLVRHPRVRLALLFGSSARGHTHEHSDIDIAVTSAGARVDLLALASELALAFGREVDVVSLDRDPPVPLLQELLRDGICIYESEPGAEASFRARAWWTIETDGPMIERMARSYLRHLATRSGT